MPETREDDLFRESTMTFGQHLAELRVCLVRSVTGLGLGFIVGLLVGGPVVEFIQRPLQKALTAYREKETLERLSGLEGLPWTTEELKQRIEKDRLLAEQVYVDPTQLILELKKSYPSQFRDVPVPEATAETKQAGPEEHSKDIRLVLWHDTQDDSRVRTKSLSTQEPFTVYVKASLLVGILLSSPWVFFQIWNFVAAGLYPHERHYVYLYLPFSLGLFLFGAALAFFVVFEPILNFLLSFNRSMGIDPDLRLNEWVGFVLLLPVGFGIGFQLPLIMLFLERIGVFTVGAYLKQWRIAILVIFVAAAFLMPPDPYSMLFLAFPLTLLYFGGIILCKVLPRRSSPYGTLEPH